MVQMTVYYLRISTLPTVVGTVRPRISIGATRLSSALPKSYLIRTATAAPASSSRRLHQQLPLPIRFHENYGTLQSHWFSSSTEASDAVDADDTTTTTFSDEAAISSSQHHMSMITVTTEAVQSTVVAPQSENDTSLEEISTTASNVAAEIIEPEIASTVSTVSVEGTDLAVPAILNEEVGDVNSSFSANFSVEDIGGKSSNTIVEDLSEENSRDFTSFLTDKNEVLPTTSTATPDELSTNNVVDTETKIPHATSSNDAQDIISVKSEDSSNNIDKDINQDGRKQNEEVSLLSFMSGERPTITTSVEQITIAAANSNAIKARTRNPMYTHRPNTHVSSTNQQNGFIPKASTVKVTMITDDSTDSTSIAYNKVRANKEQKQGIFKRESVKEMLSHVGKKLLRFAKPPLTKELNALGDLNVLGDYLIAQGEKGLPRSSWVHVEGISPVSSLDAILNGIQHALDIEDTRGIVDLDAAWNLEEPIPFIQIPSLSTDSQPVDDVNHHDPLLSSLDPPLDEGVTVNQHRWVRKAKLIISPFARPTGWYLQFDNRSIVYALLRHAQQHPIRSSWRPVQIKEYKRRTLEQEADPNDIDNKLEPISHGHYLLNDDISDATLRVENCPMKVTEASLMNFFSRYDLKSSVGKNNDKPIQRWLGSNEDGSLQALPTTYLVFFADTSWARAALREKQGTFMFKMGRVVFNDFKNPKPLHLVQYPRQML